MKNGTFYAKLMWILFGQLSEKIGLLFTTTSGHTVWVSFLIFNLRLELCDDDSNEESFGPFFELEKLFSKYFWQSV